MDWTAFASFAVYSGVSLVALLLWWVIYDVVLTRGHPVRDAVFGRRPNAAVAIDLVGGMLAMGIIIYGIIGGPALPTFAADIEAAVLSLLGTIVLLALARMGIGAVLRLWFGMRRDAQGDLVNFNNELFRQRNVATGLFSGAIYLILAAGLVEQDLLDLTGMRGVTTWNVLGVWLLGFVTVVLHSLLFIGIGTRRNIVSECFDDNNSAAAFSLLGLVAGMLMVNHGLVGSLRPGEHMFNVPALWYYLGTALAFVLVARVVLTAILYAAFGVRLNMELVRTNAAWGVLDGGLLFTLFLVLAAIIV